MPSADKGSARPRPTTRGPRAARAVLACAVKLGVALAATGAVAAEPTQSRYIADVEIVGKVYKFADESDNFHLTWHPNGSLYGAYGDGWGFVKTDIDKRAIGVSRITGTPPNLTGSDVWEGDAQGGSCCWSTWNGKSWGMISIGSTLHMWFTIGRPRAAGFLEARIATSTNAGQTWKKADWAFTPANGMLMPTFMQVGQGYQSSELPAEVMDYAYSFHTRYVKHPSNVQSPGRVLLMRSPKGQVTNRSSYEFFAGTTGSGAPIWTTELDRRVPVLEKPHILDVAPAVAWNPHLKRFIMVMGHVPAGATSKRGVGFYEAEKPWGPWYRIKEIDQFQEGTIFFYQFPTKWMSADLTAWMAFTGTDKSGGQEWDALDIVKTRFVLAGGTAGPTATSDTVETDAGKAVTIDVLANDKGTGLTVSGVTTPANGTAKINTDRTITYKPDAGFSGSDSFRYTIKDDDGRTASATVAVTVSEVTDPTPVYLGCYKDVNGGDLSNPNHDLNGYVFQSTGMTVNSCTTSCANRGFAYAGARNGHWCFCGNDYGRYGTATNCTTSCAGNTAQKCGGYGANSVYDLR